MLNFPWISVAFVDLILELCKYFIHLKNKIEKENKG